MGFARSWWERAALIALAGAVACGNAPVHQHVPGSHSNQPAAGDDPPDSPPIAPVATPSGFPPNPAGPLRAAIAAPAEGQLTGIAVTPDGGAALTTDDRAGVRLWPTLDGTREPRVVLQNAVGIIALARRGDGFIAALVDESKSLLLVALDGNGRVVARRSIGNDPGVAGAVALATGIATWTVDSKLEVYGTDGALRATLGSLPGERLVALAAAGDHLVAQIETRDATGAQPAVPAPAVPPVRERLRAVTLGAVGTPIPAAASWGNFVDGGRDVAGAFAVSPSGRRVAFDTAPLVVGTVTQTPPHVIAIVDNNAVLATPPFAQDRGLLAFTADDIVAIGDSSGLHVIHEGNDHAFPLLQASPMPGLTAIAPGANGAVVGLANGAIEIQPMIGAAQFLGYAVEQPTLIRAGAAGGLLVGQGHASAVVDAQLHAPLGSVGISGLADDEYMMTAAWLGGDDWLYEVRGKDNGLRAISHGKSVATIATSGTEVLRYEPSTRIATTSLGKAQAAYRWDPDKHALEPLIALPVPTGYLAQQLVPVAPELAGGVRMIRAALRDKPTVDWFADDKLEKKVATADVDAALAFDRAGRVFAWLGRAQAPHVAVLAAGREVGTLPVPSASRIYPDPTGARVLVVTGAQLSLFTDAPAYKPGWTRELHDVREVAWLADGAIAVAIGAGVTRLDGATGKDTALACGWGFGLAPEPRAPGPGIDSVCIREP